MICSRDAGLLQRKEETLLVLCANVAVRNGPREALRRIARECSDWPYVVETARLHGITALVSSNLDYSASDIVPREPLEMLRRRFQANAARNLFLTSELLSLIREFTASGIDALPLKGPVLAMTAYGNVALREFLDLDILVPKEQLNRAAHLLRQRGYRQPADQTAERGSRHIESQLGCDFLRQDGRVSVELHWSFLQRWLGFPVDLSALWKAPTRARLGGMDVLALPAHITLLYLCAHGTKHRWSRLCWVVDIAQLLRAGPGVDWNELMQTAESTGSRRTLFLGLHMAHILLGSEIPMKVYDEMTKDMTALRLANRLCRGVFSPRTPAGSNRGSFARDWFYLSTKERWQDRLRYVWFSAGWFFLPSQKDRQWVRLPASLGWLYIFLRPIRVSCDLIRGRSRNWC